jgi:hypothetical protein
MKKAARDREHPAFDNVKGRMLAMTGVQDGHVPFEPLELVHF